MEAEVQEATTETPQTNGATPPEAVTEQPAEATEQADGKPPGYEPVDIETATPEQIKTRVDYLYRQVKDNERDKRDSRRILAEQSRLISELSSGMGTVVHHLQDKSIADNETQLIELRKQAWEKGDSKSYDEINDKLMDLRVTKKLTTTQRQAVQPQQNQQQQLQYSNAADIANHGVRDGELAPDDAILISSWQNETDTSGNQIRPWAHITSPIYKSALVEAQAVWMNPRFTTTAQKIAEIDRRMGVAKRTVSPTVMGANLTNGKKSPKVTLSSKQQEIALRMGGPKKSDAEKLAWYQKQVEQVKSTKGARQ